MATEWDDPTRQRALELAEEHGAAEASRRTDVPAGTIRYWMHKTGRSGPPSGEDPQEWAARKMQGAREAWEAAQDAPRSATTLRRAAGATRRTRR